MRTDIILIDIASTLPNPVSFNTWKVRLVLNQKNLAFQEHWVPTSQIAATCKAFGIGPSGKYPDGSPHYTVPAIVDRTDPNRPVALSDSIPIIDYFERTYPPSASDRALFPHGTRQIQLQFNDNEVLRIAKIVPEFAISALVASKVEGDRERARKKFEAMYGVPFDQIEKKGAEREEVFEKLEREFKHLGDLIDQNEKGRFLLDDRVRFMDFALCEDLMFIKTLSPDDGWARVCSWQGGRWARYFEAFGEWIHLGEK